MADVVRKLRKLLGLSDKKIKAGDLLERLGVFHDFDGHLRGVAEEDGASVTEWIMQGDWGIHRAHVMALAKVLCALWAGETPEACDLSTALDAVETSYSDIPPTPMKKRPCLRTWWM